LYQPDEVMVVKNLNATKPAPAQVENRPRIEEKPLTDEDLQNLDALQAAHDRKYGMSPSEYLALKEAR
jgi:hypothetical protein